jgi:ketosteroid isomerase-like protein
MKKINTLLCTFIILLGCTSTPKVDIQAESDSIRNLEDQWSVALQTSDAEKIIGFYAQESVSMSPNKQAAVGLQAIRTGIESMLSDTSLLLKTYTSTVDAIEVSNTGGLAYARGHDEITMKTKDGLIKDEGKWVDIWKKLDRKWKVIVSIGNSSKPLTGQ